MVRWIVPALLLIALTMSPILASPARAADVNILLIAKDFVWHVGSETSSLTRIEVNVGDTLRLRVENRDTLIHTFTAPKFQVDETLNAGEIFFWNRTVTAGDAGSTQYYCTPHSSGTWPDRVGMIGVIDFVAPAPPQQPISIVVILIAVVVIVAIAGVAVYAMRRKK